MHQHLNSRRTTLVFYNVINPFKSTELVALMSTDIPLPHNWVCTIYGYWGSDKIVQGYGFVSIKANMRVLINLWKEVWRLWRVFEEIFDSYEEDMIGWMNDSMIQWFNDSLETLYSIFSGLKRWRLVKKLQKKELYLRQQMEEVRQYLRSFYWQIRMWLTILSSANIKKCGPSRNE